MNFKDYINSSTSGTDDSINESARNTQIPTVANLNIALNVISFINGDDITLEPLAYRVKNKVLYFVWHDVADASYAINRFSFKDGMSQVNTDHFDMLDDAKAALRRL